MDESVRTVPALHSVWGWVIGDDARLFQQHSSRISHGISLSSSHQVAVPLRFNCGDSQRNSSPLEEKQTCALFLLPLWCGCPLLEEPHALMLAGGPRFMFIFTKSHAIETSLSHCSQLTGKQCQQLMIDLTLCMRSIRPTWLLIKHDNCVIPPANKPSPI